MENGAISAPDPKNMKNPPQNDRKIRKAARLALAVRGFLAVWGVGWRLRLHDPDNILARPDPLILVLWHNRVLPSPLIYRRWFAKRGGTVLTSASGDGEILARVVTAYGMGAVRGSSSRHGARALRELVGIIRSKRDAIITPDGPRGPRYQIAPGVVQLAALTGAPIVPLRINFSSFFRLRSWDRFRVPWPWARIDIEVCPPIDVPRGSGEDAAARITREIEAALQASPVCGKITVHDHGKHN